MKISTKGRYSLRIMLDLALHDHGDGVAVKLKDIAERQGISGKYLEQIIAMLNKAGYVKSVRGSQGGYRLSKKPEDYTIGMILRITEGNLAPVDCLNEGNEDCCRLDCCATIEVWKRIYAAINDVIDNMTLANLVEIELQKVQSDSEK